MNLPEYPAACLSVGSGCAIEERPEADFARFFLPPVPERNQEQAHSSGAGTSYEDSTP